VTVAELIAALEKAENKNAEVMVVDEQGKLTLEIASIDESPAGKHYEGQVNIIVEEWPSL